MPRRIECGFDRAAANRAATGQADAISGQHARERMQEQRVDEALAQPLVRALYGTADWMRNV